MEIYLETYSVEIEKEKHLTGQLLCQISSGQ